MGFKNGFIVSSNPAVSHSLSFWEDNWLFIFLFVNWGNNTTDHVEWFWGLRVIYVKYFNLMTRIWIISQKGGSRACLKNHWSMPHFTASARALAVCFLALSSTSHLSTVYTESVILLETFPVTLKCYCCLLVSKLAQVSAIQQISYPIPLLPRVTLFCVDQVI